MKFIVNSSELLKELQKLLKKDTIWNADECVKNGVADEIYSLV